MSQQVKAGLSAVKDFLSGRSSEVKAAEATDQATREVVAAELLAAMSPQSIAETPSQHAEEPSSESKATPNLVISGTKEDDTQPLNHGEHPVHSDAPEPSDNSTEPEQERARQLFLEHGYFDEAVQNLRGAKSPDDRVAAARALGLVGSQRATAHLIAAMFDDDLEVRTAAEEALNQIGETTPGNVSDAVPGELTKNADETAPIESSVNEDNLKLEKHSYADEINITTPPDSVAVLDVASPADSSIEDADKQTMTSPEILADTTSTAPTAMPEVDVDGLQEKAMRETTAQAERDLREVAHTLNELVAEIQWRTEREAKLRSDAAARRVEEEKRRREAQQKAELRRIKDQEAVAAEQSARLQAEAAAQRHADEETTLRLKAVSLRVKAAELARQRFEMEIAREEAAESARLAEAARARDEARAHHEAELERLRNEEADLRKATQELSLQQTNVIAARDQAASEIQRLKEELSDVEAAQRAEAENLRQQAEKKNTEAQEQLRVELENLRAAGDLIAKRRSEVDAAREKADADAERLLEAQARMQAAERARAQAEIERSRLEAEIHHQVETQLQLVEETRRRGQEEQNRLQEHIRSQAEKEQQRFTEMETLKAKAEAESKQRAEKEQQILSEIDSLRIADAETRKRIEDAEVRRRAADDAYRLIAEKVQRVEAEAHARTKEEERMLEKLEAERRSVAIEAQSRAQQEKRIREEIEMFRRLEEEERPRIEEATLQLAEAERRMHERKDRLRQLSEARSLVAEQMRMADEYQPANAPEATPSDWRPIDNEAAASISHEQTSRHIAYDASPSGYHESNEYTGTGSVVNKNEIESATVNPAVETYLNSVDPYKRAAAVAELARLGSPDAFSRIADCFDDHSLHVRNAAARALRNLEPARTVDLFNRALENAPADRRRNIGAAIAASGLAEEAIKNLGSDNREDTYNALSILFVMAKTGEVTPLVRALEEHGTDDIGKAVSKLLTLSGHKSGKETAGGTT